MSNEVNSFTQTVKDLVDQVNIALEFATQTNKSLTTQEDTVTMYITKEDEITGDSSIVTYAIPSYNKTINQVNAVQQTVDTFVKGEGKVLLNDGTYREVKTIPVATAPITITNVAVPTTFSSKSNWFFESLMFPLLVVSFDLKNKIDDRSDRIKVRRLIFDNYNDYETQWFLENIASNTNLTYYDVTSLLTSNSKNYWIDEQEQPLPLFTRPYTGSFKIVDKRSINNKDWFVLDTLNYGIPSDEPVVKNLQLAIGNQLRYNNSIYKIEDIQITDSRVHVIPIVGMDHPTINTSFEIYSTPFSEKKVDLAIGYNECNSIFLKGVNDDYNLLGDEWSNAISFYTNDLIIEDGADDLETYYLQYVSDFGKQMEGQAKENAIPAYFGVKPNSPVISASQFNVTQVNVQLNASLDTEDIKNTKSQIESSKTIINSLKTTLAQQKAELVELTNPAQRDDLQSKIDTNISQLSKTTVEYQSLVKSLSTLAYENDAVLSNPKYRLRGFFEIPTGQTVTTNTKETVQEIIQFETAYRYLRLDNTGNPLNTYSYVDPSSGQTVSGTFSDWNIVASPIKSRTYNETTKKYEWSTENISDGEAININQVDIGIQKGEKVQLKIRSISEAGWPMNPLKSDWCEPVIVDFPSNLSGSDQIYNILLDAQAEEANIKLEETLNAAGIYTHLSDGVPNPNSANGTYFKHQSQYIAFDKPIKNSNGDIVSEITLDLQSQLSNLCPNTFVTITNPSGSSITSGAGSLTGTLQQLLQAIVDTSPGIYAEFLNQITP